MFNNLALLYHRRADYERAESQYLQALAIKERTRGPDDPTVAETAANLGAVYYASAQYEKAVQVLRRALAIQEKHLSPNHASLATSSFNLAAVYFDQGDYTNAEVAVSACADDRRAGARSAPPATGGTARRGWPKHFDSKVNTRRAEGLYKRALQIREQALGRDIRKSPTP